MEHWHEHLLVHLPVHVSTKLGQTKYANNFFSPSLPFTLHIFPLEFRSSSPISVYKYTQLDELKAFSAEQAHSHSNKIERGRKRINGVEFIHGKHNRLMNEKLRSIQCRHLRSVENVEVASELVIRRKKNLCSGSDGKYKPNFNMVHDEAAKSEQKNIEQKAKQTRTQTHPGNHSVPMKIMQIDFRA